MEDKATLTKARQELEDLYLGVRDESVDLTFKDMISFQQNDVEERSPSFKNMTNVQQNGIAERKVANMEPIHEDSQEDLNNLTKPPSLDISKALQATKDRDRRTVEDELYREHLARNSVKRNGNGLRPHAVESSLVYDDASVFSTVPRMEEKGGRKRPGITHSNICTSCSEYIYFFQHRCLVCGRVYCRNCVGIGMGEMTEGRKCIDCLGRRFSQRYIQKAGQIGCWWRYPSTVKRQELIWAEKGSRRSSERRYGRSSTEPRSRSPAVKPGTPSRSHVIPGTTNRLPANHNTSPRSFVASPTFSPNPHNFPL